MKKVLELVLSFFGGGKLWMLGAAAVMVALGYIGWLRWSNERLEARNAALLVERNTAVEIANSNALALQEAHHYSEARARLAEASYKKALAAAEKRRIVQKEIVNVPASENCAVGPGAQSAIDRVWGVGSTD
jgi:hypothetical protein